VSVQRHIGCGAKVCGPSEQKKVLELSLALLPCSFLSCPTTINVHLSKGRKLWPTLPPRRSSAVVACVGKLHTPHGPSAASNADSLQPSGGEARQQAAHNELSSSRRAAGHPRVCLRHFSEFEFELESKCDSLALAFGQFLAKRAFVVRQDLLRRAESNNLIRESQKERGHNDERVSKSCTFCQQFQSGKLGPKSSSCSSPLCLIGRPAESNGWISIRSAAKVTFGHCLPWRPV